MTYRTFIAPALLAILVLASAGSVFAQSAPYAFSRQGLFDCSAGEFSSSVGARAATGGAYVPVNDAAVTINTYQILYKECVLREVVARQRELATASHQRSGVINFMTARNGEPLFPRVLRKDYVDRGDETILRYLQSTQLNALNPAIREQVKRAIARGYMTATRSPNQELVCEYEGDLAAALEGRGTGSVFATITAFLDPACVPFTAQMLAESAAYAAVAEDRREMELRLAWGNGIYGIETIDANGDRVTQTPGSIVGSNLTQLLQTGFKQLENADDIGQMVGALFSGMSAHVIGDTRGLLGLAQSSGGQLSYLDQVARESAQGLRGAVGNAALGILSTARQAEMLFNQAVRAIADVLTRTIGTLRARETACWELVISQVCNGSRSGNDCTDSGGAKYTIATSTYPFAQNVINAQIAPLASSTVQNIESSERALELLGRLIQAIGQTASPEAQRVALEQLDALIANRQIHSQLDATAMQKTQQDITNAMAELITGTTEAWADAPDPSVGWCNVNNAGTIALWRERWKK